MPDSINMKWVLLLTGTIVQDPHALAAWIAPEVRERQYFATISSLAHCRAHIDKVIFCENSSANLEHFSCLTNLYKRKQRTLEIYKVPAPKDQKFMGKGWGEGLMIRWALENVKSLAVATSFIKITGRYQVMNLSRITKMIGMSMKETPPLKFICQDRISEKRQMVYTDFFWTDKTFYMDHLLDVYREVNDQSGVYLEHVIARRLLGLCKTYEIGVLPIPLIVMGTRGWNGMPYMKRSRIIRQYIKQSLLPLPVIQRLTGHST